MGVLGGTAILVRVALVLLVRVLGLLALVLVVGHGEERCLEIRVGFNGTAFRGMRIDARGPFLFWMMLFRCFVSFAIPFSKQWATLGQNKSRTGNVETRTQLGEAVRKADESKMEMFSGDCEQNRAETETAM